MLKIRTSVEITERISVYRFNIVWNYNFSKHRARIETSNISFTYAMLKISQNRHIIHFDMFDIIRHDKFHKRHTTYPRYPFRTSPAIVGRSKRQRFKRRKIVQTLYARDISQCNYLCQLRAINYLSYICH